MAPMTCAGAARKSAFGIDNRHSVFSGVFANLIRKDRLPNELRRRQAPPNTSGTRLHRLRQGDLLGVAAWMVPGEGSGPNVRQFTLNAWPPRNCQVGGAEGSSLAMVFE